MAMVDLEPVEEEEMLNQRLHHAGGDLPSHGRVDVMADMTRFDAERLHQLITNHARYTGSTRAKHILDIGTSTWASSARSCRWNTAARCRK